MISLKNYNKRTPERWKVFGDICLFTAPLISGAVMAAPFDEPLKSWILFAVNMVLVLGKIITKFIGGGESEILNEKEQN
jgi:hypothetical protein